MRVREGLFKCKEFGLFKNEMKKFLFIVDVSFFDLGEIIIIIYVVKFYGCVGSGGG